MPNERSELFNCVYIEIFNCVITLNFMAQPGECITVFIYLRYFFYCNCIFICNVLIYFNHEVAKLPHEARKLDLHVYHTNSSISC